MLLAALCVLPRLAMNLGADALFMGVYVHAPVKPWFLDTYQPPRVRHLLCPLLCALRKQRGADPNPSRHPSTHSLHGVLRRMSHLSCVLGASMNMCGFRIEAFNVCLALL